MCQLSPVPFHGDTIFCVTIENQPYTPAKPIVENMGLAWQAQAAKLSANKERWGVMMIVIPSESGEQQTLCLPVRKLPAFLASINPKKVRPELRPKIELYQAESDDALWNYWMNGRAERSAEPVENPDKLPTPDSPLTPDQQCTLQALVKARVESIPKAERPKGLYPQIWSRFNNHFRIARYCQLPQSRLSEAIEYLTRMDLAPALPASAPLPTPKQDNVPAVREKTYREQCAEVTARVLALRNELFRVSDDMTEAFRRPFWGTGIPDDKKPFASAMNYAVQSLYMAVNKDLEAIQLLFTAYVEGEAILNGANGLKFV